MNSRADAQQPSGLGATFQNHFAGSATKNITLAAKINAWRTNVKKAPLSTELLPEKLGITGTCLNWQTRAPVLSASSEPRLKVRHKRLKPQCVASSRPRKYMGRNRVCLDGGLCRATARHRIKRLSALQAQAKMTTSDPAKRQAIEASSNEGANDDFHPASAPLIAHVIVQAPVGLLSYAVLAPLKEVVSVGTPVEVPLGNRKTVGYVLKLEAAKSGPAAAALGKLKAIVGIDENRPALTCDVMALLDFASRYYCASPSEMLSCALPAAARPAARIFVLTPLGKSHLGLADPSGRMARLLKLGIEFPKGFSIVAAMRALSLTRPQVSSLLRRAHDQLFLAVRAKQTSRGRKERVFMRTATCDEGKLSARQMRAKHLLAVIPEGEQRSLHQLQQHDTNAQAPLKVLLRLGLIEARTQLAKPKPLDYEDGENYKEAGSKAPNPDAAAQQLRVLTAEQQAALAQLLDKADERPALLFGVTGSGKTEIYLRVMAEVLAQNQTALMLVPEIALTPQLARAFRERFGSLVATFHSGLTVAERRDEWERIHSGEAKIGLGARSAIFLPLKDLGLIVVDEEHESSFKQDDAPRYNARDLAIWRGKHVGARVILGSATPSLESFYNAEKGRYRLITLAKRVMDRPLPKSEVIHLTEHQREEGQLMAEPLRKALLETLSRDEQAILFLNRRGFAPYVFCRDCGHSFRCEDCDVSLTLHKGRDVLLCHYCGMFVPTPETCQSCGGLRVEGQGAGCERLEAELKALKPDLNIVRLDRDTIRGRKDLERALGIFRRREAQVLIGTQMVAKGHDFPGVTLVGIISADNSLNFPDFRASERTFALLTQVAGRAGRGTQKGRVLVQSYEPEHPAITAALRHDYLSFYHEELRHRAELDYPPYAHICLLRFEGEDLRRVEAAASRAAEGLGRAMAAHNSDLWVLGPAPAPLARLRRLFRLHVVVKAKTRSVLRQALFSLPAPPQSHVRRIIDVDPLSLL